MTAQSLQNLFTRACAALINAAGAISNSDGGLTSSTRSATGVYDLVLNKAVDVNRTTPEVTISGATPFFYTATMTSATTCTVRTFDATGAAANVGFYFGLKTW